MAAKRIAPTDIDAYIANFPKAVQPLLKKVRATIRKAAPGVEEKISYQIPAFRLNGRYLIYFAAFKNHIGIYPSPVSHPKMKAALAPYASGKATAKFEFERPIPLALIAKLVKFKVQENRARVASTRTALKGKKN